MDDTTNPFDIPENDPILAHPSKFWLWLGSVGLLLALLLCIGSVAAVALGGGESCEKNCQLVTQIVATNEVIGQEIRASELAINMSLPSPTMLATQAARPTNQAQLVAYNNPSGQAAAPAVQPIGRKVIRNAVMRIVSPNARQTADDISAMAVDMGGWIVSSNVQQGKNGLGDPVTSGNITVRVPSDRLDEALLRIRNLADLVEDETITGQDVTDQYRDSQSRMRNLQAAEAQLQAIMNESGDMTEVLAVFNQLTATRQEIEVIQGQLNYFDESSAYSSIQVSMRAPDVILTPSPTMTPYPTITPTPGWNPLRTAEAASKDLVKGGQSFVDVVIWLLILGLPLGIVLLPLGYGGYWIWKKMK